MKRIKFARVVEVLLEFTKEDLDILMACCKAHYDGHIKSLCEVGGFVYGMTNMLEAASKEGGETACRHLTFRQADSLCKALEVAPYRFGRDPEKATAAGRLYFALKQQLNDINEEHARLNDE